jgi:hypothetical protein
VENLFPGRRAPYSNHGSGTAERSDEFSRASQGPDQRAKRNLVAVSDG